MIARVPRATPLHVILDTNVLLAAVFFGGVSGPWQNDRLVLSLAILACATAAQTPLIVSGDKHFLHVSGWSEITVVTPRQCVDR